MKNKYDELIFEVVWLTEQEVFLGISQEGGTVVGGGGASSGGGYNDGFEGDFID